MAMSGFSGAAAISRARSLHPGGDLVGAETESAGVSSWPSLAKRTSRWRAAAGGLESRVRNGDDWPGFRVCTLGVKVQ